MRVKRGGDNDSPLSIHTYRMQPPREQGSCGLALNPLKTESLYASQLFLIAFWPNPSDT
jgi:hypothetical protein